MSADAKIIAYLTRNPGANKADTIYNCSRAATRAHARFTLDEMIRDGRVSCEKASNGRTILTVGVEPEAEAERVDIDIPTDN